MTWVSVSDRHPEDLERVDVLINAQRRLVDCTYTNAAFYIHNNPKDYWYKITNKITHWMPVPVLQLEDS